MTIVTHLPDGLTANSRLHAAIPANLADKYPIGGVRKYHAESNEFDDWAFTVDKVKVYNYKNGSYCKLH